MFIKNGQIVETMNFPYNCKSSTMTLQQTIENVHKNVQER